MTRRLIAHEPADARISAVKADAYLTLVAAGWTGGRNEVGEDLALSVVQDALRLPAALSAVAVPGGTFAAWHAEVLRLDAQIEAEPDDDAVDAVSEALNAIEDAILETTPRTVEGLLAKARWVADKPRSSMYLNPLFRDLCGAIPSDLPASLGGDKALRDAVAQFRDVDFQQV